MENAVFERNNHWQAPTLQELGELILSSPLASGRWGEPLWLAYSPSWIHTSLLYKELSDFIQYNLIKYQLDVNGTVFILVFQNVFYVKLYLCLYMGILHTKGFSSCFQRCQTDKDMAPVLAKFLWNGGLQEAFKNSTIVQFYVSKHRKLCSSLGKKRSCAKNYSQGQSPCRYNIYW